jgi:hypothetical protein
LEKPFPCLQKGWRAQALSLQVSPIKGEAHQLSITLCREHIRRKNDNAKQGEAALDQDSRRGRAKVLPGQCKEAISNKESSCREAINFMMLSRIRDDLT